MSTTINNDISNSIDISVFQSLEVHLTQITVQAEKAKDAVEKTVEKFSALGKVANMAMSLLKSIPIDKLTKEFLSLADAAMLMDVRLKNSVEGSKAFAAAQQDIYRIAQANNLSLKEASDFYADMVEPIKNLGGGTKEVSAIVEAYSASLKVSGQSSKDASAALAQFSKAMADGVIDSKELVKISESSPKALDVLKEGLHLSTEQLEKMAEKGKLTSAVIGNQLIASLSDLREEAEKTPDTFEGAMTRLQNDIFSAVDKINQDSGITMGLGKAIDLARELIPAVRDELSEAFKTVMSWIDQNKEGLFQIWDAVQQFVSSLWDAGKELVSITSFVFELLGGTKAVAYIFETINFLVAGFKDGIQIVGAALSFVGSEVLNYLCKPLQIALIAAESLASVFDQDMAASITRARTSLEEFNNAGRNHATEVFEKFQRGETAVAAYDKKLTQSKTAHSSANKVKEKAQENHKKLRNISKKNTSTKSSDKPIANPVQSSKQESQAIDELEKYKKLFEEIEKLKKDWGDKSKEEAANLEDEAKLLYASAAARSILAEKYKVERAEKEAVAKIDQELSKLTPQQNIVLAETATLTDDLTSGLIDQIAAYEKLSAAEIERINASETARKALEKEKSELKAAAEARKRELTNNLGNEQAYKATKELYEANKKFNLELIFDEEEKAKRILEIEASKYREQIKLAESGSDAQKKLINEYNTWYENQNLQPQVEEHKKFWTDINLGFKDAYDKILSGGKDAFSKLKDTIKSIFYDWLYNMTIKKWVMNIGTSISGALLSGSALAENGEVSGGGSGLLGMIGNTGSLFNAMSNLPSTLSTGLSGLGTSIGTSIGTALESFGTKFGFETITNFAQGMQWSQLAGTSVVEGATSAGASFGSALGTPIPYVAAAVAAYYIATKGFGHGDRKIESEDVTASLGPSGVSGSKNVHHIKEGGWFSSDIRGAWNFDLNTGKTVADGVTYDDPTGTAIATGKALKSGFEAIIKSTEEYAKILGVKTDLLKTKNYDVKFDFGKTQEEFSANLVKALSEVSDTIAIDIVPNIQHFSRAGESASLTLARLASDVLNVNETLSKLGMQIFSLNESGFDSISKLISTSGGLQEFQKNVNSYYDNFYTPDEKKNNLLASLNSEFEKASLGALPATRDSFRELVEQIRKVGTPEQLANLLKLSSTFASIFPSTDKSAIAKQKRSMENEIFELSGDSKSIEKQRRNEELLQLDESLRPLQERIYALKDEKIAAQNLLAVSQQKHAMDITIMELTGDTTRALALKRQAELDALDPSLVAIQKRIFALQDEASATDLAEQTRKRHKNLDIQLLDAQGNSEAAITARRDLELEGLDDYEKKVKQKIWATQDAQEAIQKAQQTAAAEEQRRQKEIEDARQAAEKAKQEYEQRLNVAKGNLQQAYNDQVNLLQDTINKAHSFSQSARSLISSLQNGTTNTKAELQSNLHQQFSAYSARAKSGDADALPFFQQYADAAKQSAHTYEDYVSELALVYDVLETSSATAENQEALAKAQLSSLKLEVETLLEIDKSVMTVAEAIKELQNVTSGGLNQVAQSVYGQYVMANSSNTSASKSVTINTGMSAADLAYGGLPGEGERQKIRAEALRQYNLDSSATQKYIQDHFEQESNVLTEGLYQYSIAERERLQSELAFKYFGAGKLQEWMKFLGYQTDPMNVDLPKATVTQINGLVSNLQFNDGKQLKLNSMPTDSMSSSNPVNSSRQTSNAEMLDGLNQMNEKLEVICANTQAAAEHTAKTSRLINRAMPEGDALLIKETV